MLKVKNISTGYGKKQVLFDVSFEVNKGDIVLLAGSNGSGKSTLLKAIFGLLPLWNKGQIYFDGENITGMPTSTLLKKGILYIPQKNNLFEDLTVKENLEIAGLLIGNSKIMKQRINQILSVFTSLIPLLQKIPMRLSGGERQLLTLAMAALHEPRIILLDEPFTGLSPQNMDFIISNLKRLNEEGSATLLIVEHRIKECIAITHKVIGLKLGKVYNEVVINEQFNSSELNSVFI